MDLNCLRLSVLSLVCVLACSADNPRTPGAGGEGDAEVDIALDAGRPDGLVRDASLDGGFLDARVRPDTGVDAGFSADGGCIARGCDELGYECGLTVDNCGDPLNCNLEDDKSPCALPERCGGDPDLGPQRCGCKPRADACAAQGAQCGILDECGMPIDCGNCENGALCRADFICACTPLPDPCGSKVCGEASDGCGKSVQCGPSGGQCAVGVCEPTAGACACPPRAEACLNQTGVLMVNGCEYNCSSDVCVPDNVAACAGAECGTARNNCGDTVSCGMLAGACAPGTKCITADYVVDSTLPLRSGSYAGGYCVEQNIANALGKYAVRNHSFREAGNNAINFLNRGEAVSLVTITYARASASARLLDQGCVATTVGDPSGGLGATARSVIPRYKYMAPAMVDVRFDGAQFTRSEVVHPVLGLGSPSGFTPGIPAFCVGFEGLEVELPAGDRRRDKWWANNRCTCPTAASAALLPGRPGAADPNNYSSAPLRDCRIDDGDLDDKPGFTAKATAPLINSELYNALISHGIWIATAREDRFHTGISSEPNPLSRVVLSCDAAGGACAAPAVDCSCAERWQSVQFVPLPDSTVLDCNAFYNNGGAANESINQTSIDTVFSAPFGTCSAAGQCPAGTLCRANRCFPQTSRGACTSGNQNPCPAGTFCEGCPDDPASPETETSCRSDTSCWPTTAECPVGGSPIGGFCRPTP